MPKLSNFMVWATISCVFLVVIIGAVLISPTFVDTPSSNGAVGALLQKPFENPDDIANSLQTFAIAMGSALTFGLVIGGFLRWILKRPVRIAIRIAVAFCVFLILSVTLVAIFTSITGTLSTGLSSLAFLGALTLAIIQYFYSEWFVIDTVVILVAIGITALLGASLGIIPVIVLLILFSIYDFVAVILSGFMKGLAQGSADLRLPSMFILPYDLGSSYCQSGINFVAEKRDFMVLGTGDLIFPSILAVSVWLRLQNIFAVGAVSLGIILAYSLMFVMLKYYPGKFKFLPGLPFLCSGAILGLVIFQAIS